MENKDIKLIKEYGDICLPSLSIKKELHDRFIQAINKFNKLNEIPLTKVMFRKLALVNLINSIEGGKFKINFEM